MATIDQKYIKKIQGKEFILFEGLLNLAHAAGLKRVDSELLQLPNKENDFTAISKAVVEVEKGTFTAIGDASPTTVASAVKAAYIRMSDTRAIARAMRLAVNVGMASVEEMAESPADTNTEGSNAPQTKQEQSKPSTKGDASEPQRKAIYAISKKIGMSEDDMKELMNARYGVMSSKELTKSDASDLIEYLKEQE